MPGSWLSQYSPVNGRSVPFFWVTLYCSGDKASTAAGFLLYCYAHITHAGNGCCNPVRRLRNRRVMRTMRLPSPVSSSPVWVAPGGIGRDDGACRSGRDRPVSSSSTIRRSSTRIRCPPSRAVACPATTLWRVHFTTGTPECYGVHAIVTETARDRHRRTAVRLAARGSRTCLHHDRGVRHARGAAAAARSATDRFSAST